MPPSSVTPQTCLNLFDVLPPISALYFALPSAIGAVVLIYRWKRRKLLPQGAQAAYQSLFTNEKASAFPAEQSTTVVEKPAIPLLPLGTLSPSHWGSPSAPPRSHFNSGELARMAKGRKVTKEEAQTTIGGSLRRHSYPNPNGSNIHAYEPAEGEQRGVMKLSDKTEFIHDGSRQDCIWKRRTMEFN